jgi:predicted lipoprotein
MARTVGEKASRVTLLVLGLAAVAGPPFGCDGSHNDGATANTVDPVLVDLLSAVGQEVVLPTLDEVMQAGEALSAATDAWVQATDTGALGDAEREAAQDAFYGAMRAWQMAEIHQLGPAGPSDAVGGEDLRDEIYSWPTVNPCRVDQETVKAKWDEPTFFTGNLVNAYGLDAIGYLLFAPSNENTCVDLFDINSEGTWDALGAEGVAKHRSLFAAALTDHFLDNVDMLRDAWSTDGGDFSGVLATAPNDSYLTATEGLDAIFKALFYLETVTKDDKLARPVGKRDCDADACPQNVEDPWSAGSVDWISGNLDGFERLFTGGDGGGVDDVLVEWGHPDLAERMLQNIDNAQAVVEQTEGNLEDLVVEDPEAVATLYAAIKAITDDLKGDLATVLALEIPSEAAGDND